MVWHSVFGEGVMVASGVGLVAAYGVVEVQGNLNAAMKKSITV